MKTHSVAAEQNVIGALFRNPNFIDDVVELLSPNDFYDDRHQAAYSSMLEMTGAGNAIDVVTVCDHLTEKGVEHDFGYLFDLHEKTVSTANIMSYAKAVKDRSSVRFILQTAADLTHIATGDGTAEEKIDQTQSMITALSSDQPTAVRTAKDILKDFIPELQRRYESGGEMNGLATGYKTIDDRWKGMKGGQFIVMAGRPAMGKTTMALNIGENVAKAGGRVLVFSLEMPESELIERSLSSIGRVPNKLIQNAKVLESEYSTALSLAANEITKMDLLIDDTGALSITALASRARREHRKKKLDLIVIDYLQLLKCKAGSREQEISKISQSIKALAKELDIPIIALSQLNRSVEARTDKRPQMSDLRESGAIEQDSDIVCFLYRDDYYNENSSNPNTAEFITRKFRQGVIGDDYLKVNFHMSRFDELMGDYKKDEPAKSGMIY